MPRIRRRWAVLVTAAIVSSSGPVVTAPAAASPLPAATPPSSARVVVSMNVNGALQRPHDELRPQTWEASLDGTPSLEHGIHVVWAGERFRFSMGPGNGDALHPGLSHTPQLGLDDVDTDLGGSATLDGDLFESFDGRADLLDVAADDSGALTRFDLVYTFTQERALGAVFGEIRMNEPEQVPTLSPTAQQLVWPRVGLENDAVLATDSFRNTSGALLTPGAATVTGADHDYVLRDDSCSGAALAPGASCSITVAYRPTRGGPRVATLSLPTAAGPARVTLSAQAPLGRSVLTTRGDDYIDTYHPTTFDPVAVYGTGDYGGHPGYPDRRYHVVRDELSPQIQKSPEDELELELTKKHGKLERGTHKTHWTAREYGFTYHANYRFCEDLSGTVTIHHLQLDEDGQPTWIDVDFEQRCRRTVEHTGTIHGRLRYQDRRDTTAPAPPTKLRVENGRLRWKRSSAEDLGSTIVRVDLGRHFDPTRGMLLSQGDAQSADLPRLSAGSAYTVAAFSIDKTGNTSRPTILRLAS